MWGTQIQIFTVFVAAATASFNVEVMLHSYENPTHGFCNGGHCEGSLGSTAGSSSCEASTTTGIVHNNDDFTFNSDILNTLEITNPLEFSNIRVSDPLELFIIIYDDDGLFGRHIVDQILIPFDSSLRLSSAFSSPSTHTGTCQRASLSISYRITSNCPPNLYGPSCSVICADQMDQYYCNYLGERQCIGNFAPPQCETCLADYHPPNSCDTFCQPRDDSQGHFTCDPATGGKICLPGFTNAASDCTEEMNGDTPPPSNGNTPPPATNHRKSSASRQFDTAVGVGVGLALLALTATY